MLDPDLVLDAVVSALRSISELVDEMAGDPANIIGHTFAFGSEKALASAKYEMKSPSILVAYLEMPDGNFSGMTVFKHYLEAYIRPKNAAMGTVSGGARAASPSHLYWLMMNKPVNGGPTNIRNTELIRGLIDGKPILKYTPDEMGDLFTAPMMFTEIGDA